VIPPVPLDRLRRETRDVRVPQDLLARTVVVMTSDGPALVVIASEHRLDIALVGLAVGDRGARLATESEVERRFGCETGAVPPLPLMLRASLYVDPAVLLREEIAFAAGRRDLFVRMTTDDLFGADPLVVAPLTLESGMAAVA
jgi:prolyl-tRNA editing enzyme YbaK/EbsC (Cys-tRNA(Pro) deacylase)